LLRSARSMGQQVRALYRAYGQPVTLLAESEGALVARTYALDLYRPGSKMVDRLVIFDMPSGSPGVYYPQAGRQGWGVGFGWGRPGAGGLSTGMLAGSPAKASFARLAVARLITAMSDPWHTPYLVNRLAPSQAC